MGSPWADHGRLYPSSERERRKKFVSKDKQFTSSHVDNALPGPLEGLISHFHIPVHRGPEKCCLFLIISISFSLQWQKTTGALPTNPSGLSWAPYHYPLWWISVINYLSCNLPIHNPTDSSPYTFQPLRWREHISQKCQHLPTSITRSHNPKVHILNLQINKYN